MFDKPESSSFWLEAPGCSFSKWTSGLLKTWAEVWTQGVTTVRPLGQIGFTSGNCSWQRGTKYWAAVSADLHGAPSQHGSCCLGATALKVTPRGLRWLQMCLRRSWAGRWTPQGPGCTGWLFVCGSRTSVWWDPCPCIPCLLSFRRHCPQCLLHPCDERSQGLECRVTQVAAIHPSALPRVPQDHLRCSWIMGTFDDIRAKMWSESMEYSTCSPFLMQVVF